MQRRCVRPALCTAASQAYLEFVQVLKLGNEIALQVQNAKVLAKMAQQFDLFNVGLMER